MAGDLKLFDYQEEAVKQLERNHSYALFFRMGRGKTLPVLKFLFKYIIAHKDAKILIIAPLYVARETWHNEIKKWNFDINYVHVIGNKKQKAINTEANLYITNRESVVWLHKNGYINWDIIVVDELSSFKDSKSQRYRSLIKFKSKRFIGLTGSPAANSLVDLWPQANLIKPGILFNYKNTFLKNFFNPVSTINHIVIKWEPKSFAKEAIFKMLEPVSMYKESVEVSTVHVEIPVYLSYPKMYKKLEQNCILEFNDLTVTALNAAVLNSKLRQMASGNIKTETGLMRIHDDKIKALYEFIENQLGNNILIWYDFVASKMAIIGLLESRGISYTLNDVEGWNKGLYSIFLAHPKSMGLGVNLQHGGHVMLWYELPYSLELYEQGLARMVRTGQSYEVEIFYLLVENTVDALVLKKLRAKDMDQLEFLNQYLEEKQ
jgi:SNF2 family DNA or RNA helicase